MRRRLQGLSGHITAGFGWLFLSVLANWLQPNKLPTHHQPCPFHPNPHCLGYPHTTRPPFPIPVSQA